MQPAACWAGLVAWRRSLLGTGLPLMETQGAFVHCTCFLHVYVLIQCGCQPSMCLVSSWLCSISSCWGRVALQTAFDCCCSVPLAHCCCRPKSSGLIAESSFGAMAVEADSMEDKLQLVQTKRRWVSCPTSTVFL
jgi:hypothetical protein